MEADDAKMKDLHAKLTKVSGSEGAELKTLKEKYEKVRNKLGKVVYHKHNQLECYSECVDLDLHLSFYYKSRVES